MNRFVIALVLGAIAISTAHAALDDTQQQIEKRYGEPVKEGKVVPPATKVSIFEQGTVKIQVSYLGGRAQHIKYYGKIEKSEIDAILKSNQSGSQTWVKFSDKKGSPKPRMGRASSCWTCPLGAEAHIELYPKSKNIKLIEFATDTWLKAKGSSF